MSAFGLHAFTEHKFLNCVYWQMNNIHMLSKHLCCRARMEKATTGSFKLDDGSQV